MRRRSRTRTPAVACTAGLVLLLGLGGNYARAQAPPAESNAQRVHRSGRRPGTHYLLELSGGLLTTGEIGPAFSGLFGVGGKPPGLPLRLYAISEVGYGEGDSGALGNSPTRRVRDQRSYLDLRAGVRAYLPIGPVRLFADALAGATRIDAQVSMAAPSLGPLNASGWKPLFALGGGAQVRLIRQLSIGLRSTVVLTDEDIGDLRQVSGQQPALRTNVMAGLTCHF